MNRRRIQPGLDLDGFLIGERIHQGGMASIWAASHPDFSFPLLVKVPVLTEGADPAAIVGFEMEQMILPRLSGPHVPRFVAAGDFTVQPYIVMERIAGRSLLQKLGELPLPYDEVASIGARLATAIHDLHGQHVIHLDVKPSNVMVRESGEAVLIDFGLSRHDHLPDLMEEQFRLPYGTAPYMSPEQILGIRRDPRSDLFSLGVLLYFFSTGKRPFGDPKGKRQLQKRLWKDPVPPRKLRRNYPPWLQEIVLRCLEVDPARRHPTAAQLAFDLTHPGQVKLTARSERLKQDPWKTVFRRRFQDQSESPVVKHAMAAGISAAPIVAVAVELGTGPEALSNELRVMVERILETVPGARVACLNVLKRHRVALDQTLDDEGQNKHLGRLVELRHWARPLEMAEDRISYHVLESPDVAAALRPGDVIAIKGSLGSKMKSVVDAVLAATGGQAGRAG